MEGANKNSISMQEGALTAKVTYKPHTGQGRLSFFIGGARSPALHDRAPNFQYTTPEGFYQEKNEKNFKKILS